MTIDQAIKLQSELKELLPEVGFNKYQASTQLGIEALRRLKSIRVDLDSLPFALLPGETKD